MHPTFYIGHKTIYPGLAELQKLQRKSKEPVTDQILLRTHDLYKNQVKTSLESGQVEMGVKGFSYLSKWIEILNAVYIDKMHLIDIGTFKTIFNSFFESKNFRKEFYLGNFYIL